MHAVGFVEAPLASLVFHARIYLPLPTIILKTRVFLLLFHLVVVVVRLVFPSPHKKKRREGERKSATIQIFEIATRREGGKKNGKDTQLGERIVYPL